MFFFVVIISNKKSIVNVCITKNFIFNYLCFYIIYVCNFIIRKIRCDQIIVKNSHIRYNILLQLHLNMPKRKLPSFFKVKKLFSYRTAFLAIYYIAFFTLLGDFIYKQFSILSFGSK